jgi:hypothetical protein
VETHTDNKEEFLLFTKLTGYGKQICERISSLQTGLYFTYIKPIEHVAYKIIFQNIDTFRNWHDPLGHPRIGMIKKLSAIPLVMIWKTQNFPKLKIFAALLVQLGN